MEFEVFGGLTELFTGMEKDNFDSIFDSNDNTGDLENNVSDTTNADNNVVSADLQEQDSNDDTLLDEDLDEVMENFRKRSEQISDEETMSQKERDALTFAALSEIEQTLVLEISDDEDKEQEKEVNHVSCPGKEHAIDVEQYAPAAFGGFMTSSGGASWRTPSGGVLHAAGNHPRYHEASRNSRNVNHVSAPFSGQSLGRPGPWSHGVLGRTSMPPSFISSSSSSSSSSCGVFDTPSILLGGLVDVSSFRSPPISSKNSTSWNNLHGVTLEQPSSLSSSSLSSPFCSSLPSSFSSPFSSSLPSSFSSPFSSSLPSSSFSSPFSSSSLSSSSYPPTQWNDIPQGVSALGCGSGGGGVAIPQKRPEESVGRSSQMSRFENLMENYRRVCNMSKKGSCSSMNKSPTSSEWDTRSRRRREQETELPEELEVVRRVRQNGKSKGQIDTYYVNKNTNQRFRSLQEIKRSMNLD